MFAVTRLRIAFEQLPLVKDPSDANSADGARDAVSNFRLRGQSGLTANLAECPSRPSGPIATVNYCIAKDNPGVYFARISPIRGF